MANIVSTLRRRRSSLSCSCGLVAVLVVAVVLERIAARIVAAEAVEVTFQAIHTPTVMDRVAGSAVSVS